jgi:hypothetical protein
MPDQPADDKSRRKPDPVPPREAPPAFPRKDEARVGREAGPRPQAAEPAPEEPKRTSSAAVTAETAAPGGAPAAASADEADRDALRRQWKEEAQAGTSAHDKKVRNFLLRLSLLNWGIAVVAWTISAFLGITSPASIIVYSVLFVIGLVAAILAILTYLLEKFGHEVTPIGPITGGEGDGDSGDDAAAAGKGDTAAPAAT